MDRRATPSKPRSRPATSKLATRRLTSHSNGPGSVSSKSLIPNTSRRSGPANVPKLERWASPHSWAFRAVRGSWARSQAITHAAPRKNVIGETSMRPYRMGISSGRRVLACSWSSSIGSGRDGCGCQPPCLERGTAARAALPSSSRSAVLGWRRGARAGSGRHRATEVNARACQRPPVRLRPAPRGPTARVPTP